MEHCGNCGREIDLTPYDTLEYIYKTDKKVKGSTTTTFFCGYKCRKEAMERYEQEKERKKQEAVEKRKRTRERNKQKLINA